MEHHEESFSYTYSAKEQAELENIRKKYLPKEADKMEELRRLDRIPYQKAQVWSLCIGIIGALILGTGMSLAMTELGEMLGSHRELAMLIGIVIGIVGMMLVALAYPIYNRVLKKQREKIAPEILRLSDELMKGWQ